MKYNGIKRFDVAQFEVLETSADALKGGFSVTMAGAGALKDVAKAVLDAIGLDVNGQCNTTNNCNGGNCVSSCGSK